MSLNLKKNPKLGQCAVMRCTKPSLNGPLCTAHGGQEQLPYFVTDGPTAFAMEAAASTALVREPSRAELVVSRRDELLETLAGVSTLDLKAQIQFEGMTEPVRGLVALGVLREDARKMHAELDALRTEDKAPHLAECKAVDSLFKPVLDTAKAVVKACTDRIEEHANAQRAEQERVLAENRAALEARQNRILPDVNPSYGQNGEPVVEVLAPLQPIIAVELPPQVRFRTEFSYEVSDLSLIPEAHWRGRTLVELHAFVLEHIKTTHGTSPIPGIEIVRTEKVVTK